MHTCDYHALTLSQSCNNNLLLSSRNISSIYIYEIKIKTHSQTALLCRTYTYGLVLSFACLQNLYMCPGTIFCFCAELTDVSWYYLFLLCRTCMCPSFCVELVHVSWYSLSSLQNVYMCPGTLFLLCRTCTCVLVLFFFSAERVHVSWYSFSSLQNVYMCPGTIFFFSVEPACVLPSV